MVGEKMEEGRGWMSHRQIACTSFSGSETTAGKQQKDSSQKTNKSLNIN
jgi:hypothetical protein